MQVAIKQRGKEFKKIFVKVETLFLLQPLSIPRADECQRFVHTLQDLRSDQAEQDDDLCKPLR